MHIGRYLFWHEAPFSVWNFAVCRLLKAPNSPGSVGFGKGFHTGNSRRAFASQFFGSLLIHVSLPVSDNLSQIPQLLKVIRCIVNVFPLKTKPFDVFHYGSTYSTSSFTGLHRQSASYKFRCNFLQFQNQCR